MFPLFHVTARSAVVTSAIWAGAPIVLRDGFSPTRFWDDVRESEATYFAYMGAVIHLLWAQPERADDADNAVRRAFGAAAPPAIVEAFERRFGMELIEVYGSTELGPATAPTPEKKRRGTMGVDCSHVELEIHDERDRRGAAGTLGEIVARPTGPHSLFQGYWQEPEATLEAFRNLWFHTGDQGQIDEDGFLTFTDRIKDSIRRRGENISSFEVERSVQTHAAVLECAAYAVPSELTEEEVMIAVVPREGVDGRSRRAARPLHRGDPAFRRAALRAGRRRPAEDAEPADPEVHAAERGDHPRHRRSRGARDPRAEVVSVRTR